MSEMIEDQESTAPAEDQDELPTGSDAMGGDAQPPHQSPTLAAIDESRRPLPEVACGACPMSTWFLAGQELQCYCRSMFLITWKTSQPGNITLCDGQQGEQI